MIARALIKEITAGRIHSRLRAISLTYNIVEIAQCEAYGYQADQRKLLALVQLPHHNRRLSIRHL